MTQRYVTLMAFETPSQAEYHRELLENAAIPCVMSTGEEEEVGVPATVPGMRGAVHLQVKEQDLKQASALIEEQSDAMMGGNPATN